VRRVSFCSDNVLNISAGSPLITHPILTGMSLGRGSIFLIEGSVTNTAFHILTPQLWGRPSGFVFPQSKLDAWAFEGTANIIVRSLADTHKYFIY
jgi:hypothetical protein